MPKSPVAKYIGIINEIVDEVAGGAHRFVENQLETLKKSILKNISVLKKISIEDLISNRNEKFLNITNF